MAEKEILQGRLQGNERGYAFLIPSDGRKEDYFIPHTDLRGAMHGDLVLCETDCSGEGKRTTARVLKVLERGIEKLTGTYFTSRSGGYVVPDEKKYFNDIFIPAGKGSRAKSGDKVVARILSYPARKNPEGIIVRVLGRQFEKKAELKAIEITYNLPEKFDKEIIDYTESLAGVSDKDFVNRKDLRNLLCFTIDGEDARDFDDAVSIERLSGGKYLLGVHIADVSHYVKAGSILDKEAFNRGTSVYFPEKVIPMLPERLSNDLCSLREGEDRLTLSVFMTVDSSGNITEREITPSVIKSRARMTYNQVQTILDGGENADELNKKYWFLTGAIKDMEKLADILSDARDRKGSIDLDIKESAIFADKNGNIEVRAAKKDKAHGIIEEFMISANVTVAEYMFYLDMPFIYRVHEKPAEEKTEGFYAFLDGLGVRYKRKKGEVFPMDFQTVLKNAENTDVYNIINRVMLRSMQKAKYSPESLGHFGLSEKHYCHFTSPIRRYPDLTVHRIIKDFLAGEQNLEEKYSDFVSEAAKHSSETERNAAEAERAVDEYYKMLYISGFIGESFEGVVSGVTNFGIFVELDSGIEGLIRTETIKGRRYLYDEKNYLITDGKNIYKLGQRVKVIVAGVNISERRAEFLLDDGKNKNTIKTECKRTSKKRKNSKKTLSESKNKKSGKKK